MPCGTNLIKMTAHIYLQVCLGHGKREAGCPEAGGGPEGEEEDVREHTYIHINCVYKIVDVLMLGLSMTMFSRWSSKWLRLKPEKKR